MKNKSAHKIWKELKTPKPNKYNLTRFCNTNLYILKDENKKFGIVLSNTIDDVKIYKNLNVEFHKKLFSENQHLDDCLLIKNKFLDHSLLFAKAFDSIISKRELKDKNSSREIYNIINEVRHVFSRIKINFQEIVGVWGELYLINLLLEKNSSKYDMSEIISGWESEKGRAVIDFCLNPNQTKIEVKTTVKEIRTHHINTLDQVICDDPWTGFLASLCISEDKDGKSCYTLLKEIESKLDESLIGNFFSKIEIRGKEICNDKTNKFNLRKELSLYKFEDIAKPKVDTIEITNVEWDINLEDTPTILTNTILKFT